MTPRLLPRRCAALFLMLPALPALAAPATRSATDALSWSSIFSVLFGLAIVIALLLGSAWLLRRLQRVQGPAQGAIQVVDQLPLGMKDRLLLVRVGGQQVLIGISAGQMRALHAWQGEAPAASAVPAAAPDAVPAAPSPFMDQLRAVLAASARKP